MMEPPTDPDKGSRVPAGLHWGHYPRVQTKKKAGGKFEASNRKVSQDTDHAGILTAQKSLECDFQYLDRPTASSVPILS